MNSFVSLPPLLHISCGHCSCTFVLNEIERESDFLFDQLRQDVSQLFLHFPTLSTMTFSYLWLALIGIFVCWHAVKSVFAHKMLTTPLSQIDLIVFTFVDVDVAAVAFEVVGMLLTCRQTKWRFSNYNEIHLISFASEKCEMVL